MSLLLLPRPPVFDPLVHDPDEPLEPPVADEEEEPEEEEPDEAPAHELVALEAEPLVEPKVLDAGARRELALMIRLRAAFERANGVQPDLDEDGKRALADLVDDNTGLVKGIAGRYANHGVPRDDLFQEGMIGLFRAARKFDILRGFRFSTYAMWWIRQAILQTVHEQGRMIRIPNGAVDQLARTRRTAQELARQGLPSGADAVAVELGMQPKQVMALWRASRQHLSIEGGRSDDDEGDVGDLLEAHTPTPDEAVQELVGVDILAGALMVELSPRERRILRLRYGLEDGQVYPLSIVGLEFSLSRERVRQIEAEALRKLGQLRHLRRRLEPYLTS